MRSNWENLSSWAYGPKTSSCVRVQIPPARFPVWFRMSLPTGPETIVEVTKEELLITAQVERKAALSPQDAIRFSFSDSKIHLFDQDTGLRLN